MATTLAHANLANEQKEVSKSNVDELVIEKKSTPPTTTKEVEPEYNVIFKLAKKKKGRYYLDNCCDNVTNPETGNPEMIWLLTGANSIWSSKIESLLNNKARYERARMGVNIVFTDGVCRVRSTDKLRLEFMKLHSRNIGSDRAGAILGDFFEYNPQQEQRDRHAKQLMKLELVIKAKEMPMDKAKKIASFLGVKFVDEIGRPIDDEGIRTELMIIADSDPVRFQQFVDSKEVEISWLVRSALIDNKIDLGGADGNITWAKGRGFITRMPSSRKPLEYLTEFALGHGEDSLNFRKQLEQIVT